MAATPEKKVKTKVESILRSAGVYYFFPATYGYGRSGVPDIICCVGGRFLAIECKAAGGTTTGLQDRELLRIRNAGGSTLIINEENTDQVLMAVVTILKSKEP
jgi:Holliday junction resolvase